MNLQLLPQKLAIQFALGAFVCAWVVGLLSDVPLNVISLRATIGAAAFWVLGLVTGKVFVNGVIKSVAEHLSKRREEDEPPQRR